MAYADILRSSTWSGADVASLIEGINSTGHPLAFTTWSPTLGANGSMTWTSTVVSFARYVVIGKLAIFGIYAYGTVGGVVNTSLTFTTPFTPQGNAPLACCGYRLGGGNPLDSPFILSSGATISVRLANGAAWTAGAVTGFNLVGICETT